MIPIKETAAGVVLQLQVLPRSSQSKLVGFQGDFLRLKLTSPPVEGRANDEVIRFLAGLFGTRKDQIRITGGLKARKKTVAIAGLSKENVEDVLAAALPSSET